MKRADRLMAILIALQQRAETAQSLADKLEVSRRTILRDMQALAEMGVPLYAVAGPTGGFRLMDGFRLAPLQLDAQEAMTMMMALQALSKLADSPFRQARWTVIDKLRASMPPQTLRQIEPLLTHLELDIPQRTVKAPLLSELLACAADKRWLQGIYRSERQRRTLTLWPEKVYTAHGFWYCEAYSAEHGEYRTFRVDRFEQIALLPEPQPELRRQAESARREPRPDRGERVRIVARLTYRGALLAEQDEHIGERVRQVSDEMWELDFMCPQAEWKWAIRFFYALGADANVTAPSSLREEIYRLACAQCRQYSPDNHLPTS